MRNKNSILIAIAVLIVGGIAAFAVPKIKGTPAPTPTPTVAATATPQSTDITVNIEDGKTALAALEDQQKVEVKSYSFGDMVTSINGLAATDTEGWSFYVNGTLASVGAGDYTPKSGDRIEFRYEKF